MNNQENNQNIITEDVQPKKKTNAGLIAVIAVVAVALIAVGVWVITSIVNAEPNIEEMTPEEAVEYSLKKTFGNTKVPEITPVKLEDFYFGAEVDLSKADDELEVPEIAKDFKADIVYDFDFNDEGADPKAMLDLDLLYKNEPLASADMYISNYEIIVDVRDILGKAYGIDLGEDNIEALNNSFLNPNSGSDYALGEEDFEFLKRYLDSLNSAKFANTASDFIKIAGLQKTVADEFVDTFKTAFVENSTAVIEKTEIDVNSEKKPVYEVKFSITADGLANVVESVANWVKTSESVKEYLDSINFQINISGQGMTVEEFWAYYDESVSYAIESIRENSELNFTLSYYADQKTVNFVGFKFGRSNTADETDYLDFALTVHVNEKNNVKVGCTVIDAESVNSAVFEYKETDKSLDLSLDIIDPAEENGLIAFSYDKENTSFVLEVKENGEVVGTVNGIFTDTEEAYAFEINIIDDVDNMQIKYDYNKQSGVFGFCATKNDNIDWALSGKCIKNGEDWTLVIDEMIDDDEKASLDFLTIKWGKGDGIGEFPEYDEILKYTAADMDEEIVNITGALMQFMGGLPTDLLMMLIGIGM